MNALFLDRKLKGNESLTAPCGFVADIPTIPRVGDEIDMTYGKSKKAKGRVERVIWLFNNDKDMADVAVVFK
jgi:hypothetical protein